MALLATTLAACGGGGGGSGGGGTGVPGPLPDVEISGTITFDLVPAVAVGIGQGRLDYDAIEIRPARFVTVQLVDSQSSALLGSTVTSDTGTYSFTVPANTPVEVRVRAEMDQQGSPGWYARVVDNTNSDALYVLTSGQFNSGATDLTRNLHAGSGWDRSLGAYADPRAAAPFAILDTVLDGTQFLLEAAPTLVFPALTLFWSESNSPSFNTDGQIDTITGEIGTSFYSAGNSAIYLLGEEDVDTEEYDRGVILHEWSHYLEDAFSRSDSFGGPHTIGDRLDMRVAFSEGFSSAVAGMILGDGLLIDTMWERQETGFTIDVETPTGFNAGWYSEESVQAILYDLFDTVQDTPEDALALGFVPLFDVLVGEMRDSVALTSLFPFINALKANRPADAVLIDALVTPQSIATIPDSYGSGRTNPPALIAADVLPIYTDIVVDGGPVQGICSTDDFGASFINPQSVNKLGSRRFLRFTASLQSTHTFTATATLVPAGAVSDPDMELHQRGPLLPILLTDAPGKSADENVETFTWPLEPGEYVLEVYEWTNTNARDDPEFPPIGRTCFDVEITTP